MDSLRIGRASGEPQRDFLKKQCVSIPKLFFELLFENSLLSSVAYLKTSDESQ